MTEMKSGKSIGVDDAFRLVKGRLGDELTKSGASDQKLKKYLEDIARTDADHYQLISSPFLSYELNEFQICLHQDEFRRNNLWDCLERVGKMDTTPEQQKKDLKGCDDRYGKSELISCREDVAKRAEKIKNKAIEGLGGSIDEGSITIYDLDHVPSYYHVGSSVYLSTIEYSIREVLKEYLEKS